MSSESELRQDYEDAYRISLSGWQNFLAEAQRDLEFSLLSQYTEEEWDKYVVRQRRQLYTFDKTQRQLNLLEGYEQRNRHILKITPTGKEDDLPCSQFTKLIMHLMAGGTGYTGYDVLSQAFKWGNLATGSNLVEFWKDRNGNLKLHRWGFNSFLIDPMTTQIDLSDCQWILKGQWLRNDQIKRLIPEDADKTDNLPRLTSGVRWPYLSTPLYFNESDVQLYEEFWRKETKYVKTIIHRPSGREIPFKQVRDFYGDTKSATDWVNDQRLSNGMPLLSLYTKPIDKIALTIFAGGEPIWDGYNPLGLDDYNFVWFTGEWVPECPRSELKLQPFVRGLRDPQRAYNRKINQAFDIVESQIQSGKILRDNHLVNPEDVYKAGQAVVLHVDDKTTPPSMPLDQIVKNLEATDIKPGLFQLMEQIDKCTTEIKGLNNEIFGSDDKDIPGILHKFRTGAALTGQQGIFSSFRISKRCVGMKLLRLIQLNYDPFKVKRMIGVYPVPGFYAQDFDRFDCTPTEGLLTDTQRQLNYLELVNLRNQFPDAAQYIPISMLLKMAPIQGSKEVEQAVKQAEQQAQKQMQLQLQNQERVNRLVEAQAQADLARSKEDISDIQENRANIALKNAQTAVEIQKLRGESSRAPEQEQWQRMLDTIDRILKLKEIEQKPNRSAK